MSLLLFGEVHKEHWKTELGTVLGLLNPNPMKQKEGYDGVSAQAEEKPVLFLLSSCCYSHITTIISNSNTITIVIYYINTELSSFFV